MDQLGAAQPKDSAGPVQLMDRLGAVQPQNRLGAVRPQDRLGAVRLIGLDGRRRPGMSDWSTVVWLIPVLAFEDSLPAGLNANQWVHEVPVALF